MLVVVCGIFQAAYGVLDHGVGYYVDDDGGGLQSYVDSRKAEAERPRGRADRAVDRYAKPFKDGLVTGQREATSLIVIAAAVARRQERWWLLCDATSREAPACALRSALARLTARNMSPVNILLSRDPMQPCRLGLDLLA